MKKFEKFIVPGGGGGITFLNIIDWQRKIANR